MHSQEKTHMIQMKDEKIAVVGAGVMGSQIAQVFATFGFRVHLNDLTHDLLANAKSNIEDGRFGMRASVRRRKMSEAQFEQARGRIEYTTDLHESCDQVDLVIEALPENLALKLRLFKDIDRIAPRSAIVASNTAGFPITALAYATARPEKVIGWHWAQPCIVMALAEIISHDETDRATIDRVKKLAEQCRKRPIVIKDQPLCWGFVTNRINLKVREEANKIVDEGVATKEQVDMLMKDCFRWPMGIFEMYEELKF